jgi:hypothetical protein
VVIDRGQQRTTQTTLRSERRSALKKDLTEPTLLEMYDLCVYQELSVVLWRNPRRLDRQDAAILSVMDTFEPLLTLKLSIQRALLGEVTDRLIAVTCGLKERRIQIRAYVSGNVTEEDIERIQSVGGEVIADFPDGYTIDESSVSVNDGEPQMLDFWAFSRAKH